MKTWTTDDKEWMKQRREKWKTIQPKLKHLNKVETAQKKGLKKYFLTGEMDELYPLEKIRIGPLLEMWFHPDQSEEHWVYMKDKYEERRWDASRAEFRDIANSLNHEMHNGESFFDGLEERMCRWFKLDTIKRDDWPEWSDKEYLRVAKDNLSKARNFTNYLEDPNPNPYYILRWQVPVWREAMMIAYEGDYLGLEWMIEALCNVSNSPENYHTLSVELAEKIQAVLIDPEMPAAAQERITELKKQYNCTR